MPSFLFYFSIYEADQHSFGTIYVLLRMKKESRVVQQNVIATWNIVFSYKIKYSEWRKESKAKSDDRKDYFELDLIKFRLKIRDHISSV